MAGKSLLFQETCFYGELFHCYWWQRLMILTALELSLPPSFIRPCSRNARPQQQKPIVSQTKCDFTSWMFQRPFDWLFSAEEVEEYFSSARVLVCLTWNCWACPCVCVFLPGRVMRPAVPDMLRNAIQAVDMLFVWISSDQGMLYLPLCLSLWWISWKSV